MPVIVVTSSEQGAGKTGVAAAVARHIAFEGQPIRLLRTAGEASSEFDSGFFASLAFAPGTPARPVAVDSATNPRVGTYVIEATISDARKLPATRTVLVARTEAPQSLPDLLNLRVRNQ